jgi:V/A-type H+-transporting ATPase subunit I
MSKIINTQHMGRLLAAGSKDMIDGVIDTLAALNALHFIEYDGSDDGFSLGTPKEEAETVGKSLSKLRSAASLVDVSGPQKPVSASKVRSELDGSLPSAVESLLEKSTQLDTVENRLSSLSEEADVLELLSSLTLDVELLFGYSELSSFVGTVTDLGVAEKITSDSLFFDGVSNKTKVIAVFVRNSDSNDTQSLLNESGFQAINVPTNLQGSPKQLLTEMNEQITALKAEKSSLSMEIDSWTSEFGSSLVCGLELLEREHDILTAPVKVAVSEHAFFIDGWIEMSRSEEIQSALSESCLYTEVSPFVMKAGGGGHGHSDHSHHQEMPPISYQNRKISKPMELLTDAVGRPAYGRIDPTLFMFVTYPIFFGMMLGDMAYGLITISLGALIMSRAGSNEMMNLGGKFLIYIGIGTFGFGYLYAEFAGWEIIHPHHHNPAEALSFLYPDAALSSSHNYHAWHKTLPFGIELAYPFHRVTTNLEDLIILTIYLGFIHIIFGRLIGFRDVLYYGTDHGHVGLLAAFFEHGVWIVLLIGGFMFSYGYLGPDDAESMMLPGAMIASSAVVLLIWTLYNYHGIPLAISLILAPIEAIGMMPSVISYVRLFAVGIVGVKIAETGNMLWDPMKDSLADTGSMDILLFPVFFVGWLLVQLFAWGLGVFSPNIHAARLHFVEWMRQYYDSSGEVFLPFGFRTRHVEVE